MITYTNSEIYLERLKENDTIIIVIIVVIIIMIVIIIISHLNIYTFNIKIPIACHK